MQRKVNYNDMELKDTILLLLMVAVLLFSVIYTLVKIMQIRAMTSNDKLDVNEVVRVGKTDKKPVLKDYDPSGEDSGFAPIAPSEDEFLHDPVSPLDEYMDPATSPERKEELAKQLQDAEYDLH